MTPLAIEWFSREILANIANTNLSANYVSDIVMDRSFLIKKFEWIGARLKVVDRPRRRIRAISSILTLDIGSDRRSEYFEIMARNSAWLRSLSKRCHRRPISQYPVERRSSEKVEVEHHATKSTSLCSGANSSSRSCHNLVARLASSADEH